MGESRAEASCRVSTAAQDAGLSAPWKTLTFLFLEQRSGFGGSAVGDGAVRSWTSWRGGMLCALLS